MNTHLFIEKSSKLLDSLDSDDITAIEDKLDTLLGLINDDLHSKGEKATFDLSQIIKEIDKIKARSDLSYAKPFGLFLIYGLLWTILTLLSAAIILLGIAIVFICPITPIVLMLLFPMSSVALSVMVGIVGLFFGIGIAYNIGVLTMTIGASLFDQFSGLSNAAERELGDSRHNYNQISLFNNFSNTLKKHSIFKLLTFNTKEQLLTAGNLIELINNAKKYNEKHHPITPSIFLNTLEKFISKLSHPDQVLNEEQIDCLHVILEDFKNGLFGERSKLDQVIANKLLESSSLSALHIPAPHSFDDLMSQYIHHEFIPFARNVNGMLTDIVSIESVVDFIMTRHQDSACCPHKIYAPNNKVTRSGVTAYLEELPLLREIETLITDLQKEINAGGTHSNKAKNEEALRALNALKTKINAHIKPLQAFDEIKIEYPNQHSKFAHFLPKVGLFARGQFRASDMKCDYQAPGPI